MNDLQTREFQVAAGRETDEPRTVRGLAVPYGEEIELFDGYFETIAPGALAPRDESDTSLKLVYRHDEPIGLITDVLETEAGIEVAARFSDTQTARDAYELVRDGVIDRLSISSCPSKPRRAKTTREHTRQSRHSPSVKSRLSPGPRTTARRLPKSATNQPKPKGKS